MSLTFLKRTVDGVKEYEIVWEIFNQCANNQMRDIFIEEAKIGDVEQYVREKFQGKEVTLERSVLANGTVVYDVLTSGMRQRISFTEI